MLSRFVSAQERETIFHPNGSTKIYLAADPNGSEHVLRIELA
jgi:hypothetical protein